jgi:hypothetical protein
VTEENPEPFRGRVARAADGITVNGLALTVLGRAYLSNQVISIDGGTYPH